MRYTLNIYPDGTVNAQGVNFGGKATLLSIRNQNTTIVGDGSPSDDHLHLAVKVSGGKYFAGLGRPQAYAPAKVKIFRAISTGVFDERLRVEAEQIMEYDVRPTDTPEETAQMLRTCMIWMRDRA